MLKIRLQRVGRRNSPHFRIIVTDSKNGPKSGKSVELLGSYNPHNDTAQIKGDRVKYWMSVGAKVSDTVHNILVNEKVIEGKKKNVLPKKNPIKKEGEESGGEAINENTEGAASSSISEAEQSQVEDSTTSDNSSEESIGEEKEGTNGDTDTSEEGEKRKEGR